MHKIVFKEILAPNIKKIIVQAPLVAKKALPGEFVTIVINEKGERVPLTIVDSDKEKGVISLIFQEVGKSTFELGKLKVGEGILNLLGPLGKATEINKIGNIATVGGGVGIAEVFPVTRALQQAGNKVFSIIGARNKELLILEHQMQQVCDELFITTDDGSYGRKGFVTDVLKDLMAQNKLDLVHAVGPVPMMRAVSELTRSPGIKTLVSLNPVMVDATGMCGSCRITVGGETKFGCVDGPEFDGHLVDFEELQKRLKLFLTQEKQAMEAAKDK
ncbi:MAG: sulfide/dihydroorotate dehydrogenase-like FAD/NAD-binding protein [Candidatus Omnitrophica bacterium]|nr:sulfide/dihydroorotate dehydrogenase-like FAD/NAD-binding protein [Candidatus Omnitrophota bacterium]